MYRTVTDTISEYPNTLLTFYRRGGSFDVLESYPPKKFPVETDDDGHYEIELWANGGGLIPSEYMVVYPGKDTIRFVLPEGDEPITMPELRALEAWDWNDNPIPGVIDIERARYASTNPALGSALIGFKNDGDGTVDRTVRARLTDSFYITDYNSFAEAVTAAAGETLVILSAVTVAANTTVPSTVTLEFTRAGRINPAVGVTVTINGPIEAGRWPIFGGLGTIAGEPLIDYACPEWFGAAGADATGNVDAAAMQKAVDFFPVVRGNGNTEYIINSHRVLFCAQDLHALGARDTPQFNAGYGAGFVLGSNAILEDCHFLLTGEAEVPGQLKAKHCVAIGEVDGDRTTNVIIRRNTFRLHPNMQTDTGVAISTGRPRGYVACSVDGLTFEDNRFEAPAIDVEPRENNMTGGFVFDSTEIVFRGNHLLRCNFMAAIEYCRHIKIVQNEAVDSWQFVDCDKMNRHITIANNTYIRTENLTTSSDPVFEINACDDVLVENNDVTYPRTFLVVSGKDELYQTWAEALAQGGSGRHWVAWNRVRSLNNNVSYTGLQAVLVGSTWETNDGEPRHADIPAGHGLTLKDHYYNSGGGLGRSLDHGIIQIQEGTGIEVRCTIDGDVARYTTLVGNVEEGATTFEVADASNISVGDWVSVILQTDEFHSQSHQTVRVLSKVGDVLTVSPSFPVTNPLTGHDPLSPIATNGTAVRIGFQNAAGVWCRSWVNGDTYTIDVAGVPTQFTVTDATDWSDLDIVIGGSIRNTAWPAITASRASMLVLDEGLQVTDCGFHQVNQQQVLITRPELRQAIIRIRGVLIRRKLLAVASGLQIGSENFRTGGFSVDISDTRITGHTTDLVLRDTQDTTAEPPPTLTESLALFSIDATNTIGTTNINATTALSFRRKNVISASGPPTGTAARDAWPRVGDIVMKHPPVAGQPIGWKCTDATAKPGVWKSLGNLES